MFTDKAVHLSHKDLWWNNIIFCFHLDFYYYFFCIYKTVCTRILLLSYCENSVISLWSHGQWWSYKMKYEDSQNLTTTKLPCGLINRAAIASARALRLLATLAWGVLTADSQLSWFAVWICPPCWCAWQFISGLATPLLYPALWLAVARLMRVRAQSIKHCICYLCNACSFKACAKAG